MAIKITHSEYVSSEDLYKRACVMDSAADAANLPAKSYPGSVAMVAAKDGPIYMVNASGEWEEL